MTKLDSIKKQYQESVKRFKETLKQEKSDINRDSAIKRFELTFDLAWKLIKTFLEEEKGIVCASPKACFREAYRQGLVEYDDFWLRTTDLRTEAVHTYSQKLADALYKKLPETLKNFQQLQEKLV